MVVWLECGKDAIGWLEQATEDDDDGALCWVEADEEDSAVVAVRRQFQSGLRGGGDVLQYGLEELAPLLLHNLLRDNPVGNVVHMCIPGDNPCGDVDDLVLLLRTQDEFRIRREVRQEQGVLDCGCLADSQLADTGCPGFYLGGPLVGTRWHWVTSIIYVGLVDGTE